MSPQVQTLVALALVAIASGYLALRGYRWWFGKSAGGCGSGCSGCASKTPLVTLEVLSPSKGTPGQP